jgi:uncharacterized protein (TIGR02246 family)
MTSTDEEAIFREVDAFTTAWNQGDAAAAAGFFTDDGVRVGAFGDRQRGRAELQVAFEQLLHGSMPGAVARQERGTIRMLSPELALWQGGLEIIPPNGAPLKGHVVQVMKKIEGRWLILEAHPKFFPPRPA